MNELKIKYTRMATQEEWDLHWQHCDYATFFHSRQWHEVWQQYKSDYTAQAELVIFSDDKAAVIPACVTKKQSARKYISSPARTYGGWISVQTLEKKHAELLYNYLISKDITWRINAYDPHAAHVASHKDAQRDVTDVIPLLSNFDDVYVQWSSNHKKSIKKGIKENQVKLATTQEEWDTYFSLYQKSIARWGDKATSNYSQALFDLLYNLSSDHIKLWLTYHQGEIIAGGLCFYAPKHVVCWHSAVDDAYFRVKPVHTMFRYAIEDACQRGYQWFDFNPSGGHDGVKQFKQGFATIELDTPVLRATPLKSKIKQKISQLIAQVT